MTRHRHKYQARPNSGHWQYIFRSRCCWLIFVLVIINTLLLTACAAETNRTWNIALLVKSSESDFFQTVKLGAEAAGKEYNADVRFTGPASESEIQEQIRMLYEMIESDNKPDVLLLAAADVEALAEPAQAAIDAGVPVITVDSGVNLDSVSSVIETDNLAVGSQLGHAVADAVDGKATILLVNFVAGTSTAEAREQGFLDAVVNYKDIEIANIVFCNSQEQLARELVHEQLALRPDINVVVGLNAHGTIGAGRAILDRASMGIDDNIRLFGVDSTPEEVLHLDRGTLEATVIQNPYAMGYFGVQQAVRLLQKEKIDKLTYTDSVLITRENMYAPENQKLVFPLVE
ncbi:MAG: substrate-binding domain-containing protein [Eubacteriales bacterium]|nr:substrate-binding domain-containing protein [Eubacteriales bacterium]